MKVFALLPILLFALRLETFCQDRHEISQVTRDTLVTRKRLDEERFKQQLKKLQGELVNKSHLFYALESFSAEFFVEEYAGKELNAYAFNPCWEKLKSTLKIIETEFSIWNVTYSQSRVLTETNFMEIKRNFDLITTKLNDQSLTNCNSQENCTRIKKKIVESRTNVRSLITELTKFILL